MHESDLHFAAFLASRNKQKVRRERFRRTPQIALIHEYDNTTQQNLALIRAQVKDEQKVA